MASASIQDLRKLTKDRSQGYETSSKQYDRSTQEQLRLDHIETLQVLQEKVDEIECLKAELASVRDRGESPSEASIQEESSVFINKIMEQDKEIKALKGSHVHSLLFKLNL